MNYGASQDARRDEDGQSEASSDSARRYKVNRRLKPHADIYGAESQWSTKLSGNSFQPNSPNEPGNDAKKSEITVGKGHQSEAGIEIITASSVMPNGGAAILVSSDEMKTSAEADSMGPTSEEAMGSMMQMDFGQKNSEEDTSSEVMSSSEAPRIGMVPQLNDSLETRRFRPSGYLYKKVVLVFKCYIYVRLYASMVFGLAIFFILTKTSIMYFI